MNDTGLPGKDHLHLKVKREDLIRDEIADNAKFTLNQFVHLACTSLSYTNDTDVAEIQQLFTYKRSKPSGEWYLGIQVRILSIQNASTGRPAIQKRIVTAKAPGYRCHLSAADHKDDRGYDIATLRCNGILDRCCLV